MLTGITAELLIVHTSTDGMCLHRHNNEFQKFVTLFKQTVKQHFVINILNISIKLCFFHIPVFVFHAGGTGTSWAKRR